MRQHSNADSLAKPLHTEASCRLRLHSVTGVSTVAGGLLEFGLSVSIGTIGTAHPCAVCVCGVFDDRCCASSVWVRVQESAATRCSSVYQYIIYCVLLTYSIGTPRVVT